MGLAALRRVLDPAPVTLDAFRDRVVAVDANNILWTFVTAMGAQGRPPTDPDGRPVAHLIGLANRLKLLAEHGIRSAWVFDGEQPKLKAATLDARQERIDAARADGNVAGGIALTRGQIRDAQDLLTALGVPWMKAPGESDAQCAHFARTGAAWAAVTQDYDAALHGAPRTGRNLTGSRTRKPELMDLDAALEAAGLTRDELVDAAILVGTDYNTGVKGVGPVKAIKLVQREGGLHGALDALGVDLPEADEIRALFLAHPVDAEATLDFQAPDAERVHAFLAARGISGRRATGLVDAIADVHAGA